MDKSKKSLILVYNKIMKFNTVNITDPLAMSREAKRLGKKMISNSQIKTYTQCNHKWKTMYIDGQKEYSQSIFFTFGTAMHETLQHFLSVMYDDTAKAAEAIDLPKLLKENMHIAYKSAVKRNKGVHFTTKFDLEDIYKQGVKILVEFVKKRGAYFSKKNCELLGIEIPILVESDVNPNIMIGGFLDVVMKENDKIKIYDIKTSYKTWDKKKKNDGSFQLRLYKKYFAKQYDVKEEDIEIEFFIVKRNIYEESDFPQSRIQQFNPASGKPTMTKTAKVVNEFISSVFNDDGSYNTDREYKAIKGIKGHNCKYCPFKTDYERCPKEARFVN